MVHSALYLKCRAAWRRIALRREGAFISKDIEQPAPCELCGKPTSEVHHIFPQSQEFDLDILFEPMFGLVVCQEPCHAMYHHSGKRAQFWRDVEAALSEKDPDRWAAISAVRGLVWVQNRDTNLKHIRIRLQIEEERQIAEQDMDPQNCQY